MPDGKHSHVPGEASARANLSSHCHFIQSSAPSRLYTATQSLHTTAAVHSLKPRIVHTNEGRLHDNAGGCHAPARF